MYWKTLILVDKNWAFLQQSLFGFGYMGHCWRAIEELSSARWKAGLDQCRVMEWNDPDTKLTIIHRSIGRFEAHG